MANNSYKNSISLGIKLQPTNEIQKELNSVIKQLEKNSAINLNIDTKQINQSLNDFSNTIMAVGEQLKSHFNMHGVADEIDMLQKKITKVKGSSLDIGDGSKGFDELQARAKAIRETVDELAKISFNTSKNGAVKDATITYTDNMGKLVSETMEWKNISVGAENEVKRVFTTTNIAVSENIKTLENYKVKIENIKSTMQNKLNSSSNNSFIDSSVISNLQSKLNSINTNTAEREIKELQQTINNLSSSDSQIVRLQNTISKMENNLTNMKGKYGSLVGDSSSRSQLESYTSQIEKLKSVLTSLQNGGTISGQKLASELNLGTNASRELSTAVKNSASALKLAQADASSFSNSIKKAFENAGLYMSVYQAINMMSNAFKDGVRTVIDMDSALGSLNKVVSMSSSQLLQMRDSAIEMGKELGRSSVEIANAQAEFGRLYKTQNEINDMTKVSVMGANVMDGVSSAEVAKSLTTIISSMKMEAKDSVGILDSMNEIQNNYRVSAQDLMNALAEVGSTAYTSGANLQKVEGYITSISVATGQSGDEVGNALRSVMSRIYKIGTEGIESAGKPEKMLKEMGVAVRDSSGQFREFSVIMDDLNAKWDSYSRTQQIAIAQSVAGVQRYNQFLALMQNYKMATDATSTALNSQGSALKENEIHMQTAEAKLGILKATTEEFYLKLINSDAVKSVIDGLTKLISTFGNLPTIVGLATASLIAFKGEAIVGAISSIGGYITSLISLASTEGIVATATGELSLVMSTNPFGMIAIAIGAVTVGLVAMNKYMEESTNYVGKINEATKGLQEIKSTENLINQYNELNSIISNTTSTTEQVASAKEKLLSVQKQIASQNPDLIDGYTKEGDALVRNIKLLEEKVSKDKKALIAQSESNYGKLINQMNEKQPNKILDTGRDSIWWLPNTWKSDLETYNNLIKQSENSENGLSEKRKETLTELSTKFGDLNKAVITMRDNGQDISGKQMFDFSTGKLVDATQYLKDIETQSNQTYNKTQLVSQAMKELNSSAGLSSNTLEKLTSVYPDMGINADNAKKKVEELNNALDSTNGKSPSISTEDLTKSFSEAVQKAGELRDIAQKLNKEQKITPDIIKSVSEAIPDIGTRITSVQGIQEALNQKIKEEEDIQIETYKAMVGNDESYYSSKVKNSAETQRAIGDILAQYVNVDEANGLATSLQNFTTAEQAKAEVTRQIVKSIAGMWAEYWDSMTSDFSSTLYGGIDLSGQDANTEQFQAKTKQYEQMVAIRDKIRDSSKKLDGALYSGASFTPSSIDTPDFGSSKADKSAEKAQKMADDIAKMSSDIKIDRYYELNNALADVNNTLTDNKTIRDGLTEGSKEYQDSQLKDIEAYKQKQVALKNLNDEQKKEQEEIKNKLKQYDFEFDANGKLINSQKKLNELQTNINNMGGSSEADKEKKQEYIDWLKEVNDDIKRYGDLSDDVIPKTTNEWKDCANEIKKTNEEIKKANEEVLSNARDELVSYILKEEQSKVDILKEELANQKENEIKNLEEEKQATIDSYDAEIKSKEDELNRLNDNAENNARKLAKLKVELTNLQRDNSTEAQGRIQDVKTQISDLELTIKKDSLQKEIDGLNNEKQKQSDDYDQQLSDLNDYYDEQEKDAEQTYKDMLDEKKAYAKADKMITKKQQSEMLSLYESYGDSYKDIGSLLGENMAVKFKEKMNGILDAFKELTNQLNLEVGNSYENITSSGSKYTDIGTGIISDHPLSDDEISEINNKSSSTSSSSSKTKTYDNGDYVDSNGYYYTNSGDTYYDAASGTYKKYASGTDNAQAGYAEVAEDGFEILIGRQVKKLKGGETILNNSTSKNLINALGESDNNETSQINDIYDFVKSSGSLINQLAQYYSNMESYSIPSINTDLNKLVSSITNNTDNSNTDNSKVIEINNNYDVKATTDFDTKLFSRNIDKQYKDVLRKAGILKR